VRHKAILSVLPCLTSRKAVSTFRNALLFSLAAFTTGWSGPVSEAMLKQQSRREFGRGRYHQAIEFARQATEADPTDAEAWYLRGWSMHYLCFDSRPLSGQTRATTDSVLSFLERATTLDPKPGDAYYSIGACYGMLVQDELGEGNVKQAVADLRAARAHGGLPDWVLEYDRQILNQCAPNAVLLDGGDEVVAGIAYLQLVEHERPDVSAFFAQITHGPWGVAAKNGVPGAIAPAPISWSRQQLLSMHSYKWHIDTLFVPVSSEALNNLGIAGPDTVFEWEVKADSEGRLGCDVALLMDIIETNRWRRPIYFAQWYPMGMDIDDYIQNCGLVQRLLPIRAAAHGLDLDTLALRRLLLDRTEYRDIEGYMEQPMPRTQGILWPYLAGLMELVSHYYQTGDTATCEAVLDRMAKISPALAELKPDLPEMVAALRKGLRAAGQTQSSAGPVYSGDTVSFQTTEPAPTDFDRFTVFWTAPNVGEGAEFSYGIRSGQGDSCFTSDPESAYPGSLHRSDMWLGEVDPAKLQGRDVVVRFWATKGKVEFPVDSVPTFQFYKNWHVIKRVPGIRKER
jgi:tetratricopeptide (TPR) repeat protein